VFRRMVFNVASANCDDHTKNFSFLLAQGGQWCLSPAYDVTHAHAPTSRWTRQHLMAVNGKTAEIARADVLEVGDRFGVPSMVDVVDQVLEAVAKWPTFADEAAVPEVTAKKIDLDIKSWAADLR